jgi:pyruvate formate lyase activating enzyme
VEGTVFNIQRYCIHDGPGIRTTVFLKGCPLRCSWCCNPESQRREPELLLLPQFCQSCGRCAEVCRSGAISLIHGQPFIKRDLCTYCQACIHVCLGSALKISGQKMTCDEVMSQVVRDAAMYEASGGGLTLSGGEAAAQPAFALDIIRLAADQGIGTVLETCGDTDFETLKLLTQHCQQVLFDLKIIDPQDHRLHTSADNRKILNNARRLAGDPRVIFRFPVIPGITDTPKNLSAMIQFLQELGRSQLVLVPYHALGVEKYKYLGRDYRPLGDASLEVPELSAIEAELEEAGISPLRA